MSVSILVGCYNQEKFLDQLLDSIFNQTYQGNIDIYVSNDCSSDDTAKLLKRRGISRKTKFNIGFKYFNQKENLGLHGRNNWKFLFNLPIQTKYLCCIDGDDWIKEDRFAKQIKYIEENNLDGSHADTDHYYEDGSLKTASWWKSNSCYIENPMTIESQCQNNRVFFNTLLVKTELFKKSYQADLFTKLNIFLGDYAATNLMLQLGGKIGYQDESLACYRWRASSESHRDRDLVISDTGHVQFLTASNKLLEGL